MLSKFFSFITVVIIISYQLVYAQEKDLTNNLQQDSGVVEHIYKLKLHSDPVEPILSLKMPILYDGYSDFYLIDFQRDENPRLNVSLSNFRLRNNINQSFQIYLKGQKKNDLGFVGEVLGYTNAAAAIGLAAYHVYKYRDKYFRKK